METSVSEHREREADHGEKERKERKKKKGRKERKKEKHWLFCGEKAVGLEQV